MHSLLSTELTNIPNIIEKLLGNNFNNTLCNAVTWLFVLWLISHFCYDKLTNAYLKQSGFPQYVRSRLSRSLWLLPIFVSYILYYVVTAENYNMVQLINIRRTIAAQQGNIASHQTLAYLIICSFYLYLVFNEGIQLGSLNSFFKFTALTSVCVISYTVRYIEIPLTLTVLIALSGMFEEVSKIFYSLLDKDDMLCRVFLRSLFISTSILWCGIYLAVIPLAFLVPLGMKIFAGKSSVAIVWLFVSLLFWLNLAIYKSMILNSIFHCVYHRKKTVDEDGNEVFKSALKEECPGNMIECSLFPPRTDDSYMISILRCEIKERKKLMMSKRKPKNSAMLVQTLKCMMAIKRKLSEKREHLDELQKLEEYEEENKTDFCTADYKDNTENTTEQRVKIKKSEHILKFSKDFNGQDSEDRDVDEELEMEKIDSAAEVMPSFTSSDDRNKPTCVPRKDFVVDNNIVKGCMDEVICSLVNGNPKDECFDSCADTEDITLKK